MAEIKKQYSLIEFDRSEDYIAYKSFRDVFFSATREQQDFFLNNCLDDKTFSHKARLMMQDIINGKDPRGILPELNLERPEWDYRGAAFIVPNNSTPQLEELCSRTAGLGAYIGTTENGTAFIQCDTMFVDTLKDSLENEFNLPFSVYDPTLENDARDFVNQMFDYGQKGEISMDEIIQGFTMEQGDFEPDIAE